MYSIIIIYELQHISYYSYKCIQFVYLLYYNYQSISKSNLFIKLVFYCIYFTFIGIYIFHNQYFSTLKPKSITINITGALFIKKKNPLA